MEQIFAYPIFFFILTMNFEGDFSEDCSYLDLQFAAVQKLIEIFDTLLNSIFVKFKNGWTHTVFQDFVKFSIF